MLKLSLVLIGVYGLNLLCSFNEKAKKILSLVRIWNTFCSIQNDVFVIVE